MPRLDFRLPFFARVSWVSPQAQDVWGPRFAAVSSALNRVKKALSGPKACCDRQAALMLDGEWTDPTWLQYCIAEPLTIAEGTPETNAFLAPIGLYPAFAPCATKCERAESLVGETMEKARSLGAAEAMRWFLGILSWPMSWSALHGIAVVQTPVCRVAYSTDSYASKYVVHRHGTQYPVEGAQGLAFPYRGGRESC